MNRICYFYSDLLVAQHLGVDAENFWAVHDFFYMWDGPV